MTLFQHSTQIDMIFRSDEPLSRKAELMMEYYNTRNGDKEKSAAFAGLVAAALFLSARQVSATVASTPSTVGLQDAPAMR